MKDRKPIRSVEICDVTLEGVSLRVTFRDIDLWNMGESEAQTMVEDLGVEVDILQLFPEIKEITVVSPYFTDIDEAKTWLENLTEIIRQAEQKLKKIASRFSVLCGETELREWSM